MDYYDITKGRKNAIMQRTYEYHHEEINSPKNKDKLLSEIKEKCCSHCDKFDKENHNFDKCTECPIFQMYLCQVYLDWIRYS